MNASNAMTAGVAADLRDKLTVVLTLKGREAFNARWIDYHQRLGLPWRIIVGDGSPSDATQSLFDRASGIRVLYRRYDDRDVFAFYRKLRDLVAASAVPYVMLCDNDDFIFPDGLARSIRFLDANPDYVSCGGMVMGVVVGDSKLASHNAAYGESLFGLCPLYPAYELSANSPSERVFSLLNAYTPTWYAVHRRDALLKTLEELVDAVVADIFVMELFVAVVLAAMGKQSQHWNSANYLRQMNSSAVSASAPDFFERALNGTIADDFHKLIEVVARHAIAEPGEVRDAFSARLQTEIIDYIRRQFILPAPFVLLRQWWKRYAHTFRAKVPGARAVFAAKERAAAARALRKGGAEDRAIAACLNDYKIVESVVCAGPARQY